jgi:hypothetical protein
VDRDVDVQESEQARTGTLPKTFISHLSRAGSLGGQGRSQSRLVSTRHASARRGTASARARVARPSPFTNFTNGPLLVHPLS